MHNRSAGLDNEATTRLAWQMDLTTEAGETVRLCMADVEQLVHSLMHHRLLMVEVTFPEDFDTPLSHATFGTGEGFAITYDEDDCVTIELLPPCLRGYRPKDTAKKAKKSKS